MGASHTPGPWRWEYSATSKTINLVGGKPEYDLTVMAFTRWGMGHATIMLRDMEHSGMNLLHKLHERQDWIGHFPGREHHKHWCASVIHPDARLIAAAPRLLAALKTLMADGRIGGRDGAEARAAIAEATGESA